MRFHEPLLLPFAAVAAGVALARYQQFPLREVTLACAALALLALCSLIARSRQLAFATCLTSLVFGGIVLSEARIPPPAPALSVRDNVPAILEGCVVDPALVAADREHFTLE